MTGWGREMAESQFCQNVIPIAQNLGVIREDVCALKYRSITHQDGS